MAKILLLGGTGAMGMHLVQLLTNTEHHVVVTSRRSRQDHDNITYVLGNAHDDIFLKSLLKQGFEVIVDFMVYNTLEFQKRYSLLLGSCEQYVFISSSRVYANSDSPITESSPRLLDTCTDSLYLQTDEYALTKARQEDCLFNSNRNNFTIVRPYITYDKYRLQLGGMEKESWIYRALKGRSIVFSYDISSKYTTLTYGHDVARAIASLLGNESALGEAFHITQPYSCTWQEILEIYLHVLKEKLGKEPKVYMTRQSLYINYPNKKWQIEKDRLYNRLFDNSKINQYINTTTFLKPSEGLRMCLTEFIDSPLFSQPYLRDEIMKDKLTGEYTPISEFSSIKVQLKYLIGRYFIPISKI